MQPYLRPFLEFIFALVAVGGYFWWQLDRQLRTRRHHPRWRIVLAVVMVGLLGICAAMLLRLHMHGRLRQYARPFFDILFGLMVIDGWVWWRIDRLLRPVRRAAGWRIALAVMMLAVTGFAWLSFVANQQIARTHQSIPPWLPASIYIWHFIVMPITVIVLIAQWAAQSLREARGTLDSLKPQPAAVAPSEPSPVEQNPAQNPPVRSPLFSRRHFLAASALVLPPVSSLALAAVAETQLGTFRIRRMDLQLPGWPVDLDGYTLSVVADIHTGVFSTPKMLADIVEQTNQLRANLVLLPGDLINIADADLPAALAMVNQLDTRDGLYMVQGNHDLIQGPGPFNEACLAANVPLLLDDVVTIQPRGHSPFQLLGTLWRDHDEQLYNSVNKVNALRDPTLFPILMAHHPHSWDQAVKCQLPLTISGHTHGGQIMLTKNIGAGPLRFRYWSGLYQKPGSTLVVSNGVGNWFPLRVNAPAEILHLTLHPARA